MTTYWDTRTNEARTQRSVEVKLSDGFSLRRPPQGWTDRILEACGLIPVTMTPRPPDTATVTHDRTVELVADVPTVVWVERPKTQTELDAETAQAERDADRAELIGAKIAEVLARMNTLEQQAATFAARPNATNNATALALINDLKNVVVPLIAAELVDAGRRDAKIVRLALE